MLRCFTAHRSGCCGVSPQRLLRLLRRYAAAAVAPCATLHHSGCCGCCHCGVSQQRLLRLLRLLRRFAAAAVAAVAAFRLNGYCGCCHCGVSQQRLLRLLRFGYCGCCGALPQRLRRFARGGCCGGRRESRASSLSPAKGTSRARGTRGELWRLVHLCCSIRMGGFPASIDRHPPAAALRGAPVRRARAAPALRCAPLRPARESESGVIGGDNPHNASGRVGYGGNSESVTIRETGKPTRSGCPAGRSPAAGSRFR